ncbi:nucleoplasmin-like, partial [Antrostomus carolinensis]|uniref:nucleoplasmin-like n=1 Tax=Antrostomus carolinensis TaxID=279965 RepID=UPI0010A98709
MSLTGSSDMDSKSGKPVSMIWGKRLSSEQDSYTFQVPEEWQGEQQLALRTVCLGETVQDEFHVVEIVPAEEGAARTPVPLATLKPSVLLMVSAQVMPDLSWNKEGSEEEEDTEEEEEVTEEEEPAEDSPESQAAKKDNAAK